MKREVTYYLIFSVAIGVLLLFQSNILRDNEESISRVVNVAAFEKVDIHVNCNIFVNLGNEQKVVMEGSKYYLDKIETKLENGILSIYEKEPDVLEKLFGSKPDFNQGVEIFVNVTHAGQIIEPTHGQLISSDSGLVFDAPDNLAIRQFVFPEGIINILSKLLGFIIL